MKHKSPDFSTPYDYSRPACPYEGSELWPINAWRDAGVGLEVIDADRMCVTFSNGISLPIIALFDREGLRVEDYADAVTLDFGHPRFGYGAANAQHNAGAGTELH